MKHFENSQTQSEKDTFLQTSRVFSRPFSFLSPKYDKGKGGNELCDCLLTFQNVYIVFQIKEKTSSKRSDEIWFEDEVGVKAREQIEKTIEIIKEANKHHFYYGEGKNTLEINKDKAIIPVIVFDDSSYKTYPRVIFSKAIHEYINVFEMNDFIDAFNTLLIPNEIVRFLSFRMNIFKKDNDILKKRFVTFEHPQYSLLVGGGIKDEADLAEIYYQYFYALEGISKEQIVNYNAIINFLDNSISDTLPFKAKIIDTFLSVNATLAIEILEKWDGAIKKCSEDGFYRPYAFWLDDIEILFVSKGKNITDEEFENYYIFLSRIYSYKYHKKYIGIICFANNEMKQTTIGVGFNHYQFNYPDKELEEKIRIFDEMK